MSRTSQKRTCRQRPFLIFYYNFIFIFCCYERISNNGQADRITCARLSGRVTEVAGSTAFTAESLGVVETLETFARVRVTAVWNAVVDVTAALTAFTRAAGYQRIAVVVSSTAVTAHP